MTNTTNTIDITTDDFRVAYVAAYVAATPSEKATIRANVADSMSAAIRSGDFPGASAWNAIGDAIRATMAAKKDAVRDVTAVVATRLATLRAAVAAIESPDYATPEGVTFNHAAMVELAASADVDAEAVATMVRVTARKSGRGNVADFIAEAASRTPGEFRRVSDMRKVTLPCASYADAAPSAGAVAACLNAILSGDRDGIDGVAVGHNDHGVLGVTFDA